MAPGERSLTGPPSCQVSARGIACRPRNADPRGSAERESERESEPAERSDRKSTARTGTGQRQHARCSALHAATAHEGERPRLWSL